MAIELNKKEISRKISRLFKEEKWSEVKNFILKLLEQETHDHWLLTQLSEVYYQEKNYTKALEYIEKALKITPLCPLALWYYAEILNMLERNEEAELTYKALIRKGVSRIAYGECGEGLNWARSIVNDCRYQLSGIYHSKGDLQLANTYLKMYIKNRRRKFPSLFNLRDVKRKLVMIQKEITNENKSHHKLNL